MKNPFSMISSCSGALKLNFGRKMAIRYFSPSSSVCSSSHCTDDECFASEDPGGTANYNHFLDSKNLLVGYHAKEYFCEEFSAGQKADDGTIKMIKLILKNHELNPGPHLKELENVRVLDILFDETSDAELCLHYFLWSGCLSGSSYSLQLMCRMISILVSGNMNHRAVDLMLHLVKCHGSEEGSYTTLLNFFCETCTERKILETMCSMLVNCYTKERMTIFAVKLVSQMKHISIFPSVWVYRSLIGALLELNQLESAWDILEEMHNQGVNLNSSINLFIRHYCAEGNLGSGWKMLLELKIFGSVPDVVDYTIVIDALCKISLIREATALLCKMTEFGVSPDSVAMSSVIDGYCKIGKLNKAHKLLNYFSVPVNIFIYNSFIAKLCTDGTMARASDYFHEMSEVGLVPDCVSYTTMVGGYCKVGDINKAFLYLGKMLKSGNQPSVMTYTLFIDCLCKLGDMDMAEVLFQNMITDGLKPDLVTYNTMMDGYGKKGYLHKAFELLNIIKSANMIPDVVTYNTLINGLVTRGFLQEAKDILGELIRRGFSVDVITYTNFIYGLSKRGSFEEAFLVWFYMTENCVKPDVVTCSALLSGYCQERRMDEANALFYKMLDIGLEPDLILYNTLIHGFCRIGNVNEACNLVKKMIESNILPNYVTYKALILGFQKHRVINPIESAMFKLHEISISYGIRLMPMTIYNVGETG